MLEVWGTTILRLYQSHKLWGLASDLKLQVVCFGWVATYHLHHPRQKSFGQSTNAFRFWDLSNWRILLIFRWKISCRLAVVDWMLLWLFIGNWWLVNSLLIFLRHNVCKHSVPLFRFNFWFLVTIVGVMYWHNVCWCCIDSYFRSMAEDSLVIKLANQDPHDILVFGS